MKKIGILFGLLGILFITSIFYSCYKKLHIVAFSTVSFSPYEMESAEMIQSDTFSFSNLRFELLFEEMELYSSQSNPLIKSSYASQIWGDETTFLQRIKDIKIFSIQHYNDNITEGNECSDFFKFGDHSSNKNNFIEKLNTTLNQKKGEELRWVINLTSAPNAGGNQQFYIEVETVENTIMRDSTKIFYLIP